MSTIKSSSANLTLNADGSGNDIKFQSNGVEKASIDQDGLLTCVGATMSGALAINTNSNVILTGDGVGFVATDDGGCSISMYAGDSLTELTTSTNHDMVFKTNATEHMRIDSTGAVTKPLQPAFCVKLSSDQTNMTAGGGDVTILFDTERFDQNADFNTGTYTFTAPVTGRYQLNLICFIEQVDASSGYMKIMINTSNVSYHNYCDMDQMSGDMDQWTYPLSVCCDMDSGDTATCTVKQLSGSTQSDIHQLTCFSGFLAC